MNRKPDKDSEDTGWLILAVVCLILTAIFIGAFRA